MMKLALVAKSNLSWMDKEDARHQTLDRSHERRKPVVRLHHKVIGVMRGVGNCLKNVFRILARNMQHENFKLKLAGSMMN